MNSKKKGILIGTIVVVLLVVVLIVLKLTEPKKEDASSSSLGSATAETFVLIEKNADNFTAIDIKNTTDEYTINKTGDTYAIPDLGTHEQMNAYYTSVVKDFTALNANKKVMDQVEDKAKYGLENPTATAVVHFTDGDFTVKLGDKAADGNFYAMLDGDDALYTISSTIGGYFTRTPLFYLNLILVESYDTTDETKTPNVTKLSIDRKDLKQSIAIEKAPDSSEKAYMSTFNMVTPIISDLNYEIDTTYVLAFFGKTAAAVTALYDVADAAKYGFDDPQAVIQLDYDNLTRKFVVGNKNEETGNYYVLVNDNGLVYDVTAENLVCMTVQPKDMISSLALLPNIADLKGVDVTLDGAKKVYTITNESIPAEESGGEPTTDTTGVDCDGKAVKVDEFKTYYQLLLSASIEDIYLTAVTTDPTCVIEYHYADGRADDVVSFYDIGNRQMAVAINGEVKYVGRSAYLEKLRTETKNLMDGKEIDTDW